MPKTTLAVRGFLLHITHHDPDWCLAKSKERLFDLDVAMNVVEALARNGMNLLIVDCEDGVAYKKHPELMRPYTAPMAALRQLAQAARERGIDIVPKLNFSAGANVHDMWMRPHWDLVRWLKHSETYWIAARDLIEELVSVCKPQRYFHIGMDEDHSRSLRQYVAAIKTLRRMIRRHHLRPVIWNDSCHDSIDALSQVHAEKSRAAEDFLPRDIVHTLWDYARCHPALARRITSKGFELWAAPGRDPKQIRRWKRAVLSAGGTGLIMTNWLKCSKSNRKRLLDQINTLGREYS
ncbi:MAG: hypothetical protein V2A58_17670 [Planctomycetota bacterium]